MNRRDLAHRVDLGAPDHLPTCGRCGDLNEVGEAFCAGCGNRLYPSEWWMEKFGKDKAGGSVA